MNARTGRLSENLYKFISPGILACIMETLRKTFERESIENGKMIGIEKYEIKNEHIYYYIKKG